MNYPLESWHAQRLQTRYLNVLTRSLWLVPAWKREEIQRELAGHIELLASEARCEGQSPCESMSAALQQLGRPTLVGRTFAWQWHKEYTLKTPRFFGALGLVTALLSSIWLMIIGFALARTFFPHGKVIILGSPGAMIHVVSTDAQKSLIQVVSGEAGVIGVNPLFVTLALAVPLLILLALALHRFNETPDSHHLRGPYVSPIFV